MQLITHTHTHTHTRKKQYECSDAVWARGYISIHPRDEIGLVPVKYDEHINDMLMVVNLGQGSVTDNETAYCISVCVHACMRACVCVQ